MKLYAFAMTPGSGKTTISKLHDKIIDIDSAVEYTPELYKLMDNNEWSKVMKSKTDSLKEYLKNKYWEDDTLILLLHAPGEARYMDALLLGLYKTSYNDMQSIFKINKYAERAWKVAEKAEIKTRKEIKSIMKRVILQYL